MAVGTAKAIRTLAAGCLVAVLPTLAWAVKYDDLALDRWAKLGEADRYQLNIVEKYYREQNWKAALAECEKFLTLYEKSDGIRTPSSNGAFARSTCASRTPPSRMAFSRSSTIGPTPPRPSWRPI